jgi:dipeptidyl aminopeptidase/acylaminoacyl peptidase
MHKPLLRRALAAALVLACGLGAARAADVPQYTIEDFLATTTMSGAFFSPDKSRILVSSDQTGVMNAFAVPVDGGKPVQLTNSTVSAVTVRGFFPNDERFLYTSDQGGNERTHLWVQGPDGAAVDLTPGEKVRAQFVEWAADGRSFFVQTNERDERRFDLYEMKSDGYERTLVYQDETGYDLVDVSADKRWLVFDKIRTEHDIDVHVWDVEKRVMKHLTPHEGNVVFQAQEFSPDGKSLYMLTNDGSEFTYAVQHDLATGTRTVVEKPDWDVRSCALSRNGKYLVVSINNDARTEIRLYETATRKPVALPKLPDAEITSVRISNDETMMAFYLNGSRSPSNLYVYEFKTGKANRLTQNLSPKIDPQHLVDADVVRFESYDGVEIPGLLYKPHRAQDGTQVPALVLVHGGPGGQSRVGYSGLTQYLVNHGYAVYAINNRGSSGYGKTFFQMDDRKHGEADLDDCVASKAFLIEQGWVDPARIGIMGGSYGGYMVLAALAFRPREFAVGIDLFGVSNWIRTLESIPAWWDSEREALYKEMGDPRTDGEYLKRISPLFHAGNIERPLLVLQGANDPRVLKAESDDIVAAARANGAEVQYLVFENEGHGFRNKKNQLEGYEAILDFCDKHLKGGSGVVER